MVGVGRRSGKTDLIQGLVRELSRRNYRVSTVKHIFEGTFDTAYKDTWKHLQAGAESVIAVSEGELVSIKAIQHPSLERVLSEVPDGVDLVLIEGFKESSNSKILAARSLDEAEKLMETMTEVIAISGPVASSKGRPRVFKGIPVLELGELIPFIERMIIEASIKRLPGLNCGSCGYTSCSELAKKMLEGDASINDCKPLAEREVILHIDGEPMYLSEFPKNFIKNTVSGMIQTLKGVKAGHMRVSLEIVLG